MTLGLTNSMVCCCQLPGFVCLLPGDRAGRDGGRRGSPHCPPPHAGGQLPAEMGTEVQKHAVLVSKVVR